MTWEWVNVKRKRWSVLSSLKRKADTANLHSLWNSSLHLEMRTHKGFAWHLLCALSVLLVSNSSYCSFLYKTRQDSLSQNSLSDGELKLRQMTYCSLWQLRLYRVLPHLGLRSAYLQGLPTGSGSATQDDLPPFHLTLLRNCEAKSHVSLPPSLFFSKQTNIPISFSCFSWEPFTFMDGILFAPILKSDP